MWDPKTSSPGLTPDFLKYLEDLAGKLDTITSGSGTAASDMKAITDKIAQLESNMAKKSDLTPLAKKTDLPDLTPLALKTDIPDLTPLVKKSDLTPLAKKSDLPDLTPVALKSDIPDITPLAKKTDIPALADVMPMSEASAPKAGTDSRVSRRDHVHERLTETFKGTLDANGVATITFAKTYEVQPVAIPQGVKAGGAISWDKEYVGTAGAWTGVKIIGYKAKPMPTTPVLSLTTLLAGLITGVNTIIGIISGYNPMQVAAGAAYDGYVLKSSQTG